MGVLIAFDYNLLFADWLNLYWVNLPYISFPFLYLF